MSESVAGFESMLNQAYEKNAILEMEIDEKELMQTNLQRLMDEARGESSTLTEINLFSCISLRSQARAENTKYCNTEET